MNLAPALKNRPLALGATRLDGCRRLVQRLRPLGFYEENSKIRDVHTMLHNPEAGADVVLSSYQMPAGWLVVSCLCCGLSERALLRAALEGGQP